MTTQQTSTLERKPAQPAGTPPKEAPAAQAVAKQGQPAAAGGAPSRVELFARQVLEPERADALYRALPAHVKPERFERNLVIALMQHPKLLDCDPRLVFREVSKAAALGLLLDPQLGEAYLITGWNAKKGMPEPQLRIGYRGLMKLGRQSGELAAIYAHEVCERDQIVCELGVNKVLVHKPDLFGAGGRGKVVGFYAVVKYRSGETDFEPMTIAQIEAIRARSDGWKAFSAGKIKSTPWSTDFDEMAKKTVLRRLLKRVPQSPELMDAIIHENAIDPLEPVDITPKRPARPRDALQQRLAGPAQQQPQQAEAGADGAVEGDEVDTSPGHEDGDGADAGANPDDGKPDADAKSQAKADAPPVLDLPPKNGSVKAWTNYRGLLIEAVSKAPNRTWLAEFEMANKDGIAVLQADFAPQYDMLRKAIAEHAQGLTE